MEAQIHPVPEGGSLHSLVFPCPSWSGDCLPCASFPQAAGPPASGEKVEPCPAARQAHQLPPSLSTVGLLCPGSAHSTAPVCPNESQPQETARPAENYSKSPKEGGHCLELLQQSLKWGLEGHPTGRPIARFSVAPPYPCRDGFQKLRGLGRCSPPPHAHAHALFCLGCRELQLPGADSR